MTVNDEGSAESSAGKRNDNENTSKRSSTPKQADQIIEPGPWTFGSFTFLNFVSAFTLVIGIVTAVIFARVYFDQRLNNTISTGEDFKPTAEPLHETTDSVIKPDAQEKTSGYMSPPILDEENTHKEDASKIDEMSTTAATSSDHPDRTADTYINKESDIAEKTDADLTADKKDAHIGVDEHSEIIGHATTDEKPTISPVQETITQSPISEKLSADRRDVPVGLDEHSEIIGHATTDEKPTISPVQETITQSPIPEKFNDSMLSEKAQQFVVSEEPNTQSSTEATEQVTHTQKALGDINETTQSQGTNVKVQFDDGSKDIEVVDEDDVVLDEIITDQHISGVTQKISIDNTGKDGKKQELNANDVINIAKNITDVEEMYQWVLEDAEIVGLENVLSELDKQEEGKTEGFRKPMLAKVCLLDRLSVISETESNVIHALNALNGLINHDNCSTEEKIFAHRKIAEKQLRQGNYAQAIEHTKSIIELDPKDTYLQVELSTYYMYAGELDKARENLEAVIEKEPENGLAMLNLGSLQMVSVGQHRPVITPFDKIAEMLIFGLNNTDPNLHEPRHYSLLYDALIRSGRESEVSQYMRKGVEEDVILSEHQLCQSFINGHPTKTFWAPMEMTYNFAEVSELIKNFAQAHGDKMELLDTHPENPFLVQSGNIEVLELIMDGYRTPRCESSPEASILCDIAEKVIGTCTFCDSHVIKMSHNAAYWKHSGITNLGLRTVWLMYNSSSTGTNLTVDVGGDSKVLEKDETFAIFDNSYVHRLRSQSPDVGEGALWIFVADSWHPNVDNDTRESLQ